MEKAFPKVGIHHTCWLANSSQEAVYLKGRGNCVSPEWELPLLQPGRCHQQGQVEHQPGMYPPWHSDQAPVAVTANHPVGSIPGDCLCPKTRTCLLCVQEHRFFLPGEREHLSHHLTHFSQQNIVIFTSNSCFQLTTMFDGNCRIKRLEVKVHFLNVQYL